jgi:hypothetical protein
MKTITGTVAVRWRDRALRQSSSARSISVLSTISALDVEILVSTSSMRGEIAIA